MTCPSWARKIPLSSASAKWRWRASREAKSATSIPQDTEVLKHKLDVRGLRICNAWFSTLFTSQPYEVTEEAFLKHRDRLYALGARVIGASEQGDFRSRASP